VPYNDKTLDIEKVGAARVTRTPDLRITNAPLYQLSYGGPVARGEAPPERRGFYPGLGALARGGNGGSRGAREKDFRVVTGVTPIPAARCHL
jgi:hypothetical protein